MHLSKLTPVRAAANPPFGQITPPNHFAVRCKLIDLGAWADEDYKVGAEDTPFSDN